MPLLLPPLIGDVSEMLPWRFTCTSGAPDAASEETAGERDTACCRSPPPHTRVDDTLSSAFRALSAYCCSICSLSRCTLSNALSSASSRASASAHDSLYAGLVADALASRVRSGSLRLRKSASPPKASKPSLSQIPRKIARMSLSVTADSGTRATRRHPIRNVVKSSTPRCLVSIRSKSTFTCCPSCENAEARSFWQRRATARRLAARRRLAFLPRVDRWPPIAERWFDRRPLLLLRRPLSVGVAPPSPSLSRASSPAPTERCPPHSSYSRPLRLPPPNPNPVSISNASSSSSSARASIALFEGLNNTPSTRSTTRSRSGPVSVRTRTASPGWTSTSSAMTANAGSKVRKNLRM